MTTKWMLALIGGVTGVALAAALAQSAGLEPMVITSLAGNLHIQQDIPCDGEVVENTPVTAGRFELTPAEGVDVAGGKRFVMTRANVSFAPFSVSGSCLTFDRTRNYTEVGVQLSQAVSFTATAAGGGVYNVTIPKDDFRLFQATIVNGDVETGYKRPSEDVTGTIDLTLGTASLHVVLAQKIHFKAGCVDPCLIGSCEVCAINETDNGTLTADVTGTIVFPDADSDGVPDRSDNCPFVANPTQAPVATPVVTPPFNLTLASCTDHAIGGAIGADVCDAGPVIVTNNAPSTFTVGPNVVTWTGEDAKHRLGAASQTVTVVDTTNPVFTFVPPDVAMNNCGPAPLGLPTATDDCAGTVGFTNNAPASFPVGTTVVTWTATDASGNHATATQNVTVVDTVAPSVSCLLVSSPGRSYEVTATDACTSTPDIRLGSFVIGNGETIKITETGRPGVRLINEVSSDQIRHFHVGKGEGVITATDPSSNVGTAVCR